MSDPESTESENKTAEQQDPSRQSLSLYEYSSCPFCARVRNFLAGLGESVESRDVSRDRERRNELVDATGSQMVPCLRIESANGKARWLHESADIIKYLKDHFARS
jgi:glutathione S-transferase